MSLSSFRILTASVVAAAGALVYWTSGLMPESVASNFRSTGSPTGFEPRATYRLLMTGYAILVPLLVCGGTVWLTRARGIPRASYWLHPERRAASLAAIERFGLVTGGMASLFVLAMHGVNMRANSLSPPRFESGLRLALLVAWLLFLALLIYFFQRRFRTLERR